MTTFAQLLRWMEGASRRERRTTAAAVVLLVALVTFALVPEQRVGPNGLEAGGLPVAEYDAAPATTVVGDGGGVVPVVPGPGPGSVTTATTPALAGGGGPTPTVDGTSPRNGTDEGVTAESIKVGFGIVKWLAVNDLGLVTDMRTDVSEAVDALVAHVNERGGVLGRRIEPVKVSPDITSLDEQRQKCLELTETEEVFAVVDSFAFWFEPSSACITAEHQTILLNGSPGSADNVRLGFPYAVSLYKDDNRKMKDLVAAAEAAGFFDPGRGFEKLGIFTDACAPSMLDAPADGLHAHLRAAGVDDWSEFRLGCDEGGDSRDGQDVAVQFKEDGVTHVLVAAHPPAFKSYLDAAASNLFYPEYFVGDYFNVIVGGLVEDYEPIGFDGALGVTQTYAGEGAVGRPLPPLAQTCSNILVDAGLPPISSAPPDDIGNELEILELCENFFLFLEVAALAGPELTREAWIEALPRVGEFEGASVHLSRFDRPGKTTGGESVKLVQWEGRAGCRCWKQLTEFGPAAG